MLNVIDVVAAAPDRSQFIAEVGPGLGLGPRDVQMFSRFLGYEEFRFDPDLTLDQMLREAEAKLALRNGFRPSDISILTYCHTLMSSGPVRHDEDGLLATYRRSGAESLSLTMNHCASGISALAALDAILPDDGLGVILVGDKAFHPTVRHIANTTIMGEASAAVLVGRRPGRFRYLHGHTQHDGRFSLNSGRPDDDHLAGFDSFYIDFAVHSIKEALRRSLVRLEEIRWLLPHNANAASWRQIGQLLGARKDQILMTSMARLGHCFAADPFINLLDAIATGQLRAHEKVMLVSIGLGATASCAILEVTQ